jgi:hypothetical protein
MEYLLPCALFCIVIAAFASLPWSRHHPNHLFMLDLLNVAFGDGTQNSGLDSGVVQNSDTVSNSRVYDLAPKWKS